MKLILLGPPGAGKGTQAEILMNKLNIQTISTGVMLRTSIKEKTPLGEIAARYINDGNFVPDDVMVSIVKERLSKDDCKDGFILDGFPRTIAQADSLSQIGIEIDKVLCIEVSDESVIKRLVGRRECSKCGAPYNIEYKKPVKDGICDICGGELICRQDDNEETIKGRLEIYHRETEPIIDYYKAKGKLVIAQGKDDLQDTTNEVFSALDIKEN